MNWNSNITQHLIICHAERSEEFRSLFTTSPWRFFALLRMTKSAGLTLVLLTVLQAFTSAQNIIQVNNVQGLTNDTLCTSLSIQNSESFISFQCDVLLPAGFQYIPGSMILTARSVDHVLNVTNMENNTIRMLSYSLNNTPFLQDSGAVVRFNLTTPATAGHYPIELNNGIIGNAESVNILDSLVAGEISLNPIGLQENKMQESDIQCFPNPFSHNLTIRLDIKGIQPIQVHVVNIYGTVINYFELAIEQPGITDFAFEPIQLLGDNPSGGNYFICFGLSDENQKYTLVKKIHFQSE